MSLSFEKLSVVANGRGASVMQRGADDWTICGDYEVTIFRDAGEWHHEYSGATRTWRPSPQLSAQEAVALAYEPPAENGPATRRKRRYTQRKRLWTTHSKCYRCGWELASKDAVLVFKVNPSVGGRDHYDNLEVSCAKCAADDRVDFYDQAKTPLLAETGSLAAPETDSPTPAPVVSKAASISVVDVSPDTPTL